MPISDHDLDRLAVLFTGLDDAYGTDGGNAVRQRPSREVFRQHIAGERALGIYPLMRSGHIWWACIDFDRKVDKQTDKERTPDVIDRIALTDAEAVREKLADLGLNRGLYLERSKSKGVHIWLFFDAPVYAGSIRRLLLHAYNEAIGKRPSDPVVEVFPKQDALGTEPDTQGNLPLGNFVNLPYFGWKPSQTRRVMLRWGTHEPIPLADFLDSVERFPAEALGFVLSELPEPEVSTNGHKSSGKNRQASLYPCTLPMLTHGLSEGAGRNEYGFLLAKRFSEAQQHGADGFTLFQNWNNLNRPPLSRAELEKVWSQGTKYKSMGCESALVAPYCQESCPIHPKNGIYTNLIKVLTEPPRYVLGYRGLRVQVPSTEVLLNHGRLTVEIARQVDDVPDHVKPLQWTKIVKRLLEGHDTEDVPDEATDSGLLWVHILDYLRHTDDREPERAPDGTPTTRDGRIYFRGAELIRALRFALDIRPKAGEVWGVVRAHGGVSEDQRFGKAHIRVWSMPLGVLPSEEQSADATQ